jgi:ribonuclease HII
MMVKFDPAWLPPAPNIDFELALWEAGLVRVCGVDEAGRGALAGPVTAAALSFPPNPEILDQLSGVNDSKSLSPAERARWDPKLKALASGWGIGFATSLEIDRHGILPATRLAMQRALSVLSPSPDHLLLDYIFLPENTTPQSSLVKGDARSLSIAGASILAKEARDKLMVQLGSTYPGYGFGEHKGYGTQEHRTHLRYKGPSPVHRLSFAPLRQHD